jgi:hypothetical protein
MKAALLQNFKANVNKISVVERCHIYGKILCLEMRYWDNTQLDTNLDFLNSVLDLIVFIVYGTIFL